MCFRRPANDKTYEWLFVGSLWHLIMLVLALFIRATTSTPAGQIIHSERADQADAREQYGEECQSGRRCRPSGLGRGWHWTRIRGGTGLAPNTYYQCGSGCTCRSIRIRYPSSIGNLASGKPSWSRSNSVHYIVHDNSLAAFTTSEHQH
jgi:hypothetical protein